MVSREKSTLPGRDYHAAEVFDLERERIFARNWFYAGRAEGLDEPGDFVDGGRGRRERDRGAHQGRRAARLLQRLPAPRLAAVRRDFGSHEGRRQVPVPRLGLLLRRPPDRHAQRRQGRDRPRRTRACGRCPSTSGRASCSSTWTPTRCRWRSRCATSTTRRCRSPASTSTSCASASTTVNEVRPTGRS